MVITVSDVLSLFKFILCVTLAASCKVGQFIIYSFGYILQTIFSVVNNFYILIRVIFEDFFLFSNDLTEYILQLLKCVVNLITICSECITYCFEAVLVGINDIIFAITATRNALYDGLEQIFVAMGEVFVGIKHLIVLLGSGIWFAVTLLPCFLVYVCAMSVYYVARLGEEVWNMFTNLLLSIAASFKNLCTFVTDVPAESLGGLIAGACIIYVMVKFHLIVYRFLCQTLLSLFVVIRENIHQRRLRMANQEVPATSDSESEGSSDGERSDGQDQLCVVCQERNKCILILPCKHLCLCNDCNMRLRNYNRICPICRTVIHQTMKVFV